MEPDRSANQVISHGRPPKIKGLVLARPLLRIPYCAGPPIFILLFSLAFMGCHLGRSGDSSGGAPQKMFKATESPRQFLPVDEADLDLSLLRFRNSLVDIVKRRDTPALLAILDPEITNSFGGTGGVPEFEEQWEIFNRKSDVWKVLGSILSMGGAFVSENEFCAPYVSARFPSDLDGFEWAAIVAADVPLLAEAREEAVVIARLSYALVRTSPERRSGDWVMVDVEEVGTGYVRGSLVRSPIDWRAYFSKRENRWVMSALVAGD